MTTPQPVIGAVLLAAGTSSRMGDFKLLLPWIDNTTVLTYVLTKLQDAGVSPVVAVTGHQADRVRETLEDIVNSSDAATDKRRSEACLAHPTDASHLQIVHNPDYADGEMVSSLKVGLRALPEFVDGILVMPGDLPLVSPETLRAVAGAFQPDRIIIPRYHGKTGHPVLFPRRFWDAILDLPPQTPPRTVVRANPDSVVWLDVADDGILMDVDTPDAYARLLRRAEGRT